MAGWWLALFPLAAAILLGPCLMGTQALAGGDYVTYWYPLFGFAGEAFRTTGTLPEWIPNLLGGMPLGESLGPSLFYPTDVAGWLLHIPPDRRVVFDVWLHLAIAGTGMCRLASAFGARPAAAVIGGLIFMLGGYPVDLVRTGTLVFLRGTAWMPWIFWAVSRAVAAGRAREWIASAALLALLPLSAGHQLFAYLALILPVFAVTLAPPARAGRGASGVAAAFAGAGVLAAIALLPSLRYLSLSLRSGGGLDLSGMGRTEVFDLPLLVLPSLWGNGVGDTGKYLGAVATGLACLGLAGRPRAGWRWALLGALAVVFALGPATPAGALLASLPLYRGFRTSAHWLSLFSLAAAVAAAVGVDVLLEAPRRGWRLLTALGLAGAVVLGIGGWSTDALFARVRTSPSAVARIAADGSSPEAAGDAMRRALRRDAVACGGAAVAAAAASVYPLPALAVSAGVLAAGELLARGLGRQIIAPPATLPGVGLPEDMLASDLRRRPGPFRVFTEEFHTFPNMRMTSGLEWVQGYHGAPLASFARFHDAGVSRCPGLPGLFTWFNTRYYLLGNPERTPGLRPVAPVTNLAGQRLVLCEDPAPLPRAFFAARVDAAGTDDEVLAALCRTPASARRVFVTGPRSPKLAGRKATGAVGRLDLKPNRITAEVASAGDGFLFCSEAWYPAWTGFVDGVRVPIERVNVMFRGIALPEGRHTVEMVYSSLPFRIGLWVSCLAWAAVAVYLGATVLVRTPAPSHEIEVQGP